MNKPFPDISLDLELLRSKLLFVEEAFFSLSARYGEPGDKFMGLGYIVGDLANHVQVVYNRLYGSKSGAILTESTENTPGNGNRQ